MNARRVTLRFALGGSRTTPRFLSATRYLPSRTLLPSPRTTTPLSARGYATPGRPKKAVGEPSTRVKRSVQRVASEKGDSPAKPKLSPEEKKLAKEAREKLKADKALVKSTDKDLKTKEKEQKIKEKAEKAKEKDKAAKERTAAAKEKKRAAAKLAKEKAAAKKAKTTPEQKKEKVRKVELKELRVAALKAPPITTRSHAWNEYIAERMRAKFTSESPQGLEATRKIVADFMKEFSQEYKSFTPSEVEHYNHIANERNVKSKAELRAWVEARTPDEIRVANKARARLRVLLPKSKAYPAIPDERAVKRMVTSYSWFTKERQASGDFRHISVPESAKLISQEWKALDGGEKQKYLDLASDDQKRYHSEYQSVYGHPPVATTAVEEASAETTQATT